VSKPIGFLLVAAPLLGAALLAGCGETKQAIEIRYDRPAAYEIPESVKKLAIAEFGGKTEADKRWGDIASDKLASELEAYNRQFHRYQLVDRKRLRAIMDERDLQLAISDTASAGKIGKLANVDAMIYGNVTVASRDEQGTRQVFDFLNKTTKTVPYTKRYCMAAVNFTMDDIVTSKTLTTVTVTREYDSEKQNLTTGEKLTKALGMGADNLAPVDQALEGLVDQCVQEFVSKVSPHRIVVSEKLMKGKSKSVDTGNKLAAAGEYAEALDCYLQAIETRRDDDGAMFDAGLMYEAMGKLDKASDFYERAFKTKDQEKYVLARRRVRVEAKGDELPAEAPAATSQPDSQAAAPKAAELVSEPAMQPATRQTESATKN
jgi:tetratricopeptide (TPR) repeat protein